MINIDKNLDNFPKKDIEIKNRIRNVSYDLLEISYEANTTDNHELKIIFSASLSLIFLFNLSFKI